MTRMRNLKILLVLFFHLDANIPWHISAYYPTYKLNDQPRTSIQVLRKAREIDLKLGFVMSMKEMFLVKSVRTPIVIPAAPF